MLAKRVKLSDKAPQESAEQDITCQSYWRKYSCCFLSSRRRHTRCGCDWSSDVCSSDLFAAMEGHYRTQRGAPLTFGGLPDDAAMPTRYALRIPRGLSLLAHGDPTAPVRGLEDIPRDEWPNTRIVHWAFDLMVGAGFAMLGLAAWGAWLWWRRGLPDDPRFLRALVVAGALGLLAIEAGGGGTPGGRPPERERG